MQNDAHTPATVPAEMLVEKRAGWHEFTRFVVANCVAIAGILILMLIFLRIL